MSQMIVQRAVSLFRDLDASDMDDAHRRIVLAAIAAEVRVRLDPLSGDLATMDEAARVALWAVAHAHGATRQERNATLQAEEAYCHRLVNELDYHNGESREPLGFQCGE